MMTQELTGFLQRTPRGTSVDLRRGHRFVAQEPLDHQQVHAELVQTRDVRVAEEVGMQVHLEPPSGPRNGLGDNPSRDEASPRDEEHRLVRVCPRASGQVRVEGLDSLTRSPTTRSPLARTRTATPPSRCKLPTFSPTTS